MTQVQHGIVPLPTTYQSVRYQPARIRIIRPKILCVEDEPLLQQLYRAVLKDAGEVVIASDGRTAVEIFQQFPDDYGLILTDYMMPQMNGLEFLRAIQGYVRPPRLLLSADPDRALQEQAVALGALAVLQKPVENQVLRSIARELLNGPQSQTLEEYLHSRMF